MTSSCRWPEFGEGYRFSHVIPDHFHGHLTGHGLGITPHDVREEMETFFQRYQSHDVRNVLLKGRVVGHMIDYIGIDGPAARRRDLLCIPGQAIGAKEGRWPAQISAIAALLDSDDMFPASFPESLCIRADLR